MTDRPNSPRLLPPREMTPAARLWSKPFYWQRPGQLFRRAAARGAPPSVATISLPWGLQIECCPQEMIGGSLWRTGIFEVVTTEILFRLTERGATAVDGGANIGYMTSVLAAAAGPSGSVTAFEPHPAVAERLRRNVERWRQENVARVEVVEVALSDAAGEAVLSVPAGFADNEGTASLAWGEEQGPRVRCARLDDQVGAQQIDILKLDVEGHEVAAMVGAQNLVTERRVRDVIFEEHERYPTPMTDLLEEAGYVIFDIVQHPLGFELRRMPDEQLGSFWDAPTLLATINPDRAMARAARRGWFSLRRTAHTPGSS